MTIVTNMYMDTHMYRNMEPYLVTNLYMYTHMYGNMDHSHKYVRTYTWDHSHT